MLVYPCNPQVNLWLAGPSDQLAYLGRSRPVRDPVSKGVQFLRNNTQGRAVALTHTAQVPASAHRDNISNKNGQSDNDNPPLNHELSYREQGPPLRCDEDVDVAWELHLVVTEVIVYLLPGYQVAQGSHIMNTWKSKTVTGSDVILITYSN